MSAPSPPSQEAKLCLDREWEVWFCAGGKAAPAARPRGRKAETPPAAPPKCIGGFGCVAGLWRHMNHLPPPSLLPADATLYLFQRGVEPYWEHPANTEGGRWMFSIPMARDPEADAAWQALYLDLAGATLDPGHEVVGLVLARRRGYTRISVWTKNRDRDAIVLAIGGWLRAGLARGVTLEYQDHNAPYGGYRHALA
jgi:hypothetical protein